MLLKISKYYKLVDVKKIANQINETDNEYLETLYLKTYS